MRTEEEYLKLENEVLRLRIQIAELTPVINPLGVGYAGAPPGESYAGAPREWQIWRPLPLK